MPPAAQRKVPPGQYLLIDADDTLWENNIYFERAIANFISFLNHHEYTPDQVREVLYDVERENIRQHGYGMHSFALALVKCFEQLSVEPLTPALHETIHGFAYAIADHPMEIPARGSRDAGRPGGAASSLPGDQGEHHRAVRQGGTLGVEGIFHRDRSRGREGRRDLQRRWSKNTGCCGRARG